jgi:16S rRNA (adenine1518-N6/adenine1519-N6)-dimethyltransferase
MRHRPRKRFGQHFLADGGVIDAIVGAVDPRPGQALVEIGPGLGAITRPLLARCGALTAVELDRDLAERLRRLAQDAGAAGLARLGRLTVIEADVLAVDFGALARAAGVPLRVVGNLPYNISSPILFHLLDVAAQVQDQHFMLQREVVDRMAAAPGGRDYGRLSVMLQWRYAIERVLDVPPDAFDPPPAVESAVVRMTPLAQPPLAASGPLGELVAVAFSQRRKLLRHTLGRWLEQKKFTGPFDTQRRAEEVPVSEYVELARALTEAQRP